MESQDYMRRAIVLAKKGEGWCHPNPLVGAVIVKDGRIIGEGYHERYGDLHAERNAIRNLKESAAGAAIYVTLEPCCHHGKQPPCTEAIISSGIRKVFIGSRDPNPLVSGKGAEFLRQHGVEVVEDFLRDECDELNPVFFHYITTKRPYVTMKYAMTIDGKIATKTGRSKWITGGDARERVHEMRHAAMGIMAGIGTVLQDDPLLNCRIQGGKSPVRIICDSRLRIPLDSQIVRSAKEYRTIVSCGIGEIPEGEITKDNVYGISADCSSDNKTNPVIQGFKGYKEKILSLLDAKVEIINFPTNRKAYSETEKIRQKVHEGVPLQCGDYEKSRSGLNGAFHDGEGKGEQPGDLSLFEKDVYPVLDQSEDRSENSGISDKVDLKKLMVFLGEKGLDSILLEGGGSLNESALKAGIVNEIDVFVAPKIFGGNAKSPVMGNGVTDPEDAYKFSLVYMERIGEDVLLRYRLEETRETSAV